MSFNVRQFLLAYFGAFGKKCSCEKQQSGIIVNTKQFGDVLLEECAARDHLEPIVITDTDLKAGTSRVYLSQELVMWALEQKVEKGGPLTFSRQHNDRTEVRGVSAIVSHALIGECFALAYGSAESVLNTAEFIEVFPSERTPVRASSAAH